MTTFHYIRLLPKLPDWLLICVCFIDGNRKRGSWDSRNFYYEHLKKKNTTEHFLSSAEELQSCIKLILWLRSLQICLFQTGLGKTNLGNTASGNSVAWKITLQISEIKMKKCHTFYHVHAHFYCWVSVRRRLYFTFLEDLGKLVVILKIILQILFEIERVRTHFSIGITQKSSCYINTRWIVKATVHQLDISHFVCTMSPTVSLDDLRTNVLKWRSPQAWH